MAINSYGITLKQGTSSSSLTKLVDIKDIPDLGNAPEMLETTTLSDPIQTYILGIQGMDALEFTANYTKADYEKVKTAAKTAGYYEIELGESGKEGVFAFQGMHDVRVTGTDVNAVVEMVITIAPSSEIELKSGGSAA